MRDFSKFGSSGHAWLLALALPLAGTPAVVQARSVAVQTAAAEAALTVQGVQVINPTTVEIRYSDGSRMTVDFYGDRIFRLFQDKNGGIVRDPKASPEARILTAQPRRALSAAVSVEEGGDAVAVLSEQIRLEIDKKTTCFRLVDRATGRVVTESVRPVEFTKNKVTLALRQTPGEYFYGGGVQNGRFSHRGKSIAIENTNNWTDGGVASPTPFYWSTGGYGVMWHTFAKGRYDFGAAEANTVLLSHDTDYLDLFLMADDGAVALLNDFYQLTGHPVLLPKFGFYEGHLNAYNRDYWKETEEGGVLFEDGKRYKEAQTDNGGVKESLNGEKNNYQFSARAVIDRYNAHDMPLGWVLPNDGYGAGYGQTETLGGNVNNLKAFGEYARSKGVEIGLWTQSDLHPKSGVEALLQRDIVKEVRDAGVRVLKTDVAWVGAGYSFGLNGVTDVGEIMPYYGNDARPFIISLDGWAGTQRYAGIWSGDQTGGEWEYIRFHIPTYIGSGLSGQPNICSDMDGIFGGKNVPVNVRDFQWKTFTSMQLNMDGWGANPKYPQALGEPAASINRWYLKLRSELMPYLYTASHEAVDGKPLVRALFLDYPNDYTLGTATRYEFLCGPSVLVAPVYQATRADKDGNDVRHGIYLPEGRWIDYFTGDVYEGGRILNSFDAPLWKLPVFVKSGSILPLNNPNNNPSQVDKAFRAYEIYADGHTSYTEYDDDGLTQQYLAGRSATTQVETDVEKNKLIVTIHPTQGGYDGFEVRKQTELRINVTAAPRKVVAKVGKKKVTFARVNNKEELDGTTSAYYYEERPNLNRFATPGSEFEKVEVIKNPVLIVRLASCDVTQTGLEVTVDGYVYDPADRLHAATGALSAPVASVTEENTEAYTLTPSWQKADNADYYEIEFNGMLYTTIRDTQLLFEDLHPETEYTFKVRAVNKDGHSEWAIVKAVTKSNPLEFAIQGVTAVTTCENQGGGGIHKLFDFDESSMWHTKWGAKAVPFEMIVDLHSVNQLDKLHYLGREDGGNGTLLRGTLSYSMDKRTWSDPVPFTWTRGGDPLRIIEFKEQPTARYLRLSVEEAVGDFGSGREMYVFKVPGSESYIPGDINHDGKIDENDLTSYMNYTGLRKGDPDYEGYISKGDLNGNGLIDAYDISAVAIELDGGVGRQAAEPVAGELTLVPSKQTHNAGDVIELTVRGKGLRSVNALSLAIPYDAQRYEYVGLEVKEPLAQMRDLTYDRLHKNGQKALYPTFVNLGAKPAAEGDTDLLVIRFKAKAKGKTDLKAIDVMLVDKDLNVK
ncbi:MAG: DUF5110 domain-containing protein [Clostridium sp.]|nr:DUF5110 domain-containing protein [Clostridium sp.]